MQYQISSPNPQKNAMVNLEKIRKKTSISIYLFTIQKPKNTINKKGTRTNINK